MAIMPRARTVRRRHDVSHTVSPRGYTMSCRVVGRWLPRKPPWLAAWRGSSRAARRMDARGVGKGLAAQSNWPSTCSQGAGPGAFVRDVQWLHASDTPSGTPDRAIWVPGHGIICSLRWRTRAWMAVSAARIKQGLDTAGLLLSLTRGSLCLALLNRTRFVTWPLRDTLSLVSKAFATKIGKRSSSAARFCARAKPLTPHVLYPLSCRDTPAHPHHRHPCSAASPRLPSHSRSPREPWAPAPSRRSAPTTGCANHPLGGSIVRVLIK